MSEGLNDDISEFMHNLDIFLYYYLMDLSSLGNHLEIFHNAVWEQGQWHWLKEEPDYDALILNG